MTTPGGTTGPGVEPTPPASSETMSRLAVLDLMRTVALLRVIAFHVTGVDGLTLIASMPVMFFVAGALFARSIQNRRGIVVVRDRYRRILPSLFVFAAALIALYAWLGLLTGSLSSDVVGGEIQRLGIYDAARLFIPVLSGEPPVGPGTLDEAVYWTWNPLWYVHTHLLLALFGPLLIMAYRRWAKATLVGVSVMWLFDAVANEGTENTITFLVFFVAGFAFTDGRLLAVDRSTMRRATFVAAAIGLAFVPFGPGLSINAWSPALLFVGAAWVAGSIAWRDQLELVSRGAVMRPLISFVNRRALTIYLWSMAGIYISRRLMPVEGGLLQLSLIATASIALTTVVILVCCVLFGWVEDLAARRSPELWPGRSWSFRR
jgi:hypothetical protein